MDIEKFQANFERICPPAKRYKPTQLYSMRIKKFYFFEPLRCVKGMLSVKKQRLLNLVYAHLSPNESYLEVGTWQGKSLIAAMYGNKPRPTYACDDFSEYKHSKGQKIAIELAFKNNLKKFGLDKYVTFYNTPFVNIFTKEKLPIPIGAYLYDAVHDEQSQYLSIKLVQPFLAKQALVIVDDWRFAHDSQSYAKIGTEKAIAESRNQWKLLYELPARFNGDRAMWWNGIAVFSFQD